MKLASFVYRQEPSFGIVSGSGVIDLGARIRGRHHDVRDVLLPEDRNALATFADLAPDHSLTDIEFLPTVPNPEKIFCVGLNYDSHIAEARRERPAHPTVFLRTARSLVGHQRPIVRPCVSQQYDFEGEMAVVIGKPGRHIGQDRALEHVAGYTCFNDGSIRDWQRHTSQWVPGKNFERSGGCGPWLLTSDEVPDPRVMVLVTKVNGIEMQRASVAEMVFDVSALIEYCSTITRLETGDLIVTGTAGGVGAARTPPVWLKPGDEVEVSIDPVGVLRNIVVDESDEI